MKKIIVLIGILIFTTHLGFAQTESIGNGTSQNQKIGFSIGYYGYKINNVGLQLGIEKYLATTNNFQIIWSSYFQFYTQKEKQTAIALNTRIGQRYNTNFGLILETHLGLGIQETFYKIKGYDLTSNPIREISSKINKTSAMPNISLGIGYDFSKKTKLPLVYYLRTNISWLYPDINLVFNTTANLEMGVIYKPIFKKK